MNVQTRVIGPLFEQPDLLDALLRAGAEVATLTGRQVRTNFSGGIVKRGAGRYGHLGDQWRTSLTTGGDAVTVRVFPQGKAAFRALFLEEGTTGHFIAPRTRRRRGRKERRALSFVPTGGRRLFRPYVHHPGSRAFHVLVRTLDQTWPRSQDLFAREVTEALNGR